MDIFDVVDGRPLTDPELVRCVLRDTIPGPGPGVELAFLVCDLNGRLITPVMLSLAALPTRPDQVAAILDSALGMLHGLGSAAAAVVRHGPIHARPEDRAWQHEVERYCREAGIRDLGFYVMGTRGVDHVPPVGLAA